MNWSVFTTILLSLTSVGTFICMFEFGYYQQQLITTDSRVSKIATNKKRELKNFSTVIYVIAGVNLEFEPDPRGVTFEYQLDQLDTDIDVVYVADGKLDSNGRKWIDATSSNPDPKLCDRTAWTWEHFEKNFPDKRWVFRGVHDTYVNITALNMLIANLEKKYDPMTEMVFSWNFHEYSYMLYPHGGAGWLMSGFAVRQFAKRTERFKWLCDGSADDVALAPFAEEYGVNIQKWLSPQHCVTWPNQQLDMILSGDYSSVLTCPAGYYLFNGSPYFKHIPYWEMVSIHLHRTDIIKIRNAIDTVPKEMAVTFIDPNTPVLCNTTGMPDTNVFKGLPNL